jgi:hypothetical protein
MVWSLIGGEGQSKAMIKFGAQPNRVIGQDATSLA